MRGGIMKLYEMMDRTPLPGGTTTLDDKTYLNYMNIHRPLHFQRLAKMLNNKGLDIQSYLNAINLGADMALLQILQHGIPEDLAEVYGKRASLWTPGG
jgi:hypothetical protein